VAKLRAAWLTLTRARLMVIHVRGIASQTPSAELPDQVSPAGGAWTGRCPALAGAAAVAAGDGAGLAGAEPEQPVPATAKAATASPAAARQPADLTGILSSAERALTCAYRHEPE
jgi:hypothetical protein